MITGFPEIKAISVFYGNGNWNFSDGFNVDNCESPQRIKVADVTGDGLTDIVLLCGGNKKLFIYKALSINENDNQ